MKTKLLLIYLILSSCVFGQSYSAADTVQLNEVVVTGTKIGIARNQVPFTVTQIPGKFFEQSHESQLLSVLSEYTPGVFVTKRGVTGFGISNGSAGQINIRGIGGNPTTRVLVLVNGNPQFAGIFGHPLPDTYLSSDVDKVEIIRGPASILYGSNSMGGVINIITKEQSTAGYQFNGSINYGSYNTAKLMLNSGFKKDKFGVFASINHDRTDGQRPSSDFKITNGYLKSDYDFNDSYKLAADFSVSQTNASDPGQASLKKPGEKIDMMRINSNVALNNEFENISGAVHLFFNYGENNVTDGFYSIDRNYGLGFYQSVKMFKGNIATVGIDYKKYGGIAKNVKALGGNGIVFGDTTVAETAGYILLQQTLMDKLILNAGYRLEHHSVYGYEHIPSAGLAYYFSNNTTIKGSVSKGFRSPTIQELFLFPPANDKLEPERVINYEIGLMQKLFDERMGLELTVFNITGDNLIKTIFAGGAPRNVNTGEVNNTGVELSAKFMQDRSINYVLNYTYIHQKEPVLSTPEHSMYLGMNYSINRFDINIGLQNIINLTTLVSPAFEKESYTLLDAGINYNISNGLGLFLKAENILNQDYHINYDYPMPGITFSGGFGFHL